MFIGPANPHFVEFGFFRRPADGIRRPIAVHLAEGVAPHGQRDGFAVVHSHSGKGFAYVQRRFRGVGYAVGPFGIDVN